MPARPFRVGIDAHYLARHEGNRSYVWNLLEGLSRIELPSGLEVVAYSQDPDMTAREFPNFEHRGVPSSPWVRTTISVTAAQVRDRLAAWHGSWVAPPWQACPLVLTVHDVLFATHRELFAPAQGIRLRLTVASALRRAERVLAPTRATRLSLLSVFPFLEPERVVLVPLGIDLDHFKPTGSPADTAARAALGVVGPYALAVGRPHPRKNLEMLFSAIARLDGLGLVVAGPLRGMEERLRAMAHRTGLAARLILVSDAPRASLAALYRGCTAFCFPSLGEGFGLPAIEALACGAPTLISTDPALLEVCGGAARPLPPGDVSGWADALRALLEQGPADAGETGPARAAAFDLKAMAKKTVEVYGAVLGL